MFNIGVPIDISNPLNGRDVMVMQSHADADYIIKEFKHRYIYGTNPNKLIDEICDDGDIDQNTLTDNDIARVVNGIRLFLRSH